MNLSFAHQIKLALAGWCLTLTAGAVQIEYTTTSDWGSGFGGRITITNDANTAINGWTLEFNFSHSIDQIWDATVTEHSGEHYTLQNLPWNGQIAPGNAITLGFNGSPGNVSSDITQVVFNGVAVGDDTPPPDGEDPPGEDPDDPAPEPEPGDFIFAEDFESGGIGTQPNGWNNFIAWIPNGSNPNGQTQALIDNTRAHSGARSIHFFGGQQPAMITRALPSGVDNVYLRAWVYMTRQFGMNPGDNHETIMGIRGTPGNANNEVRFGEIKGVIGTNEAPSDNISPLYADWGTGPAFAANTWHCIEVAFLSDPAYDTVRAWVNGTAVHTIDAANQWNNGPLPANWLDGKFNEVMFGWHSFSQNDIDVWMDDIVVSHNRIGGCQ